MKKILVLLLGFYFPLQLIAQVRGNESTLLPNPDSSILNIDSVSLIKKIDSVAVKINSYNLTIARMLSSNQLLKSGAVADATPNKQRNYTSHDELIFYLLLCITGTLAFFKIFYSRYFNTLFRVFFNTTLRQSQLTDQLTQSTLTSLFFNLLFFVIGGVYLFFVLEYFHFLNRENIGYSILICCLSLSLIYAIKHFTLKFTGWITGQADLLDDYIFIVFLMNKMLGILLIPIVIIIAFAKQPLYDIAIHVSLILVGLMLTMRLFRSFGSLQHKIKINRFHFIIYIIGIEIIPLLIIYKTVLLFLSKNL